MAWFYLLLAGLLEIVWAVGLKYTEGFTRLGPSLITLVALLLSFVLLERAVQTLPVGTAYVIWTGIGAVGTAILGMVLFHEPRDWKRLACIGLILVGVVGLRFTAAE